MHKPMTRKAKASFLGLMPASPTHKSSEVFAYSTQPQMNKAVIVSDKIACKRSALLKCFWLPSAAKRDTMIWTRMVPTNGNSPYILIHTAKCSDSHVVNRLEAPKKKSKGTQKQHKARQQM